MIRSRREPQPIPVRRYRYSKLRWRVLVRALDVLGAVLMTAWRLVRAVPRVEQPRRILLVQIDHLGDAVLTSPILPILRNRYPSASLDVLASPSNKAAFEGNPAVDRVLVAERNWFERRPEGWALVSAVLGLGRDLRREGYDLGIDVRGDILSVLVLALAGIPRRVGWAMGGGGFLLTDVASWVPGRHEVDSRLALLDCLGISAEGPVLVDVHPTDRDRARVHRILSESQASRSNRPRAPLPHTVTATRRATRCSVRPHGDISEREVDGDGADALHGGRFGFDASLLAVHLGAGTLAKRWPLRHWSRLVARFLNEGWRVVVVGGVEDLPLTDGLPSHPNLIDLTGRLSVRETTALLERSDLFIGADSGPAHLAACARVTSIVLFSGTNIHRQWRPWSRRSLVLRSRVSCRPCHRKVCPLRDHPCLAGISPDRVYRAARRWWSINHRSGMCARATSTS